MEYHQNVPKVVGIIGSRDYPNLTKVDSFVQRLPPGTVVVSGGARGVDLTAKEAALKYGLHYKPFHIEDFEWKLGLTLQTVANHRNWHLVSWIAHYGGILVAFWTINTKTGKMTGGTTNALGHAKDLGVRVIKIGVL